MISADANWRPEASWEVLSIRAQMLAAVRNFFSARGVLEVETPLLLSYGVSDPQIENITVRLRESAHKKLYLRTSPEYAMKRLLAAGSPDIYEIAAVFRDGELGPRHQPEFTLIEWYRRNFELLDMAEETCAMINALGQVIEAPPAAVEILRYRTLFQQASDIDPLHATDRELAEGAHELLGAALSQNLVVELEDSPTLALDLIMSHCVIPKLNSERLSVVTHYPASQAALAQLDSADPREARRFEVFYKGLEVANGYQELMDTDAQAERFATDNRRREHVGLAPVAADQALLSALACGLPPCSGVAVGFERALMCWLGKRDIRGVRAFSYPPLT